jgi:hypothetical protein
MNTEALFLFLILLLGLVLCSFLGGNCNKEGLTNNTNTVYNGPNGATATMSTNSSGTPIITLNETTGSSTVIFTQSSSNPNLFTNPFGITATLSSGNIVFAAPNNGPTETFTSSSSSSSSSSSPSSSSSQVVSSSPLSYLSSLLPSTSSSPTTNSSTSNNYDNYNHYSGNATSQQLQNGMIFSDPSGDNITVVANSNGTQSLQLTSSSQSTPMMLSSTPSQNSNIQPQPNTFYAPYGGITATVITDNNGQTAIQVNAGNNVVIFSQSGSISNSNSSSLSNQTTPTQYYGSTGSPIQSSPYNLAYAPGYGAVNTAQYYGPYGGSAGYAQGPYGGSAGYAQGPYGGSVGYAQGPYGNTVVGGSSGGYGNQYNSTFPQGISANQIPPGQQDLYILKSEIVPPVCPACPQSSACPRKEPCPPCPACARCPEPSFECKKVPNYSAIDQQQLPNYNDIYGGSSYSSSNNFGSQSSSPYEPQPVVADFSQFGM